MSESFRAPRVFAAQRLLATTLMASAGAGTSAAQTTDALFRSWEWAEEPHSVRAAALAGAIAASPSGASTALLQPAGLSLVSERDVRVTARYAGSGSFALDSAQSRWSLGEVAYAQPLGLRFGVGAYHTTRRAIDIGIESIELPGGFIDSGDLAAESRETGVAFGVALTPQLRLGARFGISSLDLEGRATTTSGEGSTRDTRSTIEASQPRVGVGLLFAPNQRFQAGVSYDSKARWSGSVDLGAEATSYQLTSPTRIGTGVLFRPSSVVWFLGQLDWVRWSEVRAGLGSASDRPAAGEFRLVDTIDSRFGLELRLHYGEAGIWNRIALRFGFAFRSRGLLEYIGEDETEQARFPGAGQSTDLTVGAAFGRVELAYIWRDPRGTWLFGVRQSF